MTSTDTEKALHKIQLPFIEFRKIFTSWDKNFLTLIKDIYVHHIANIIFNG